MALPLRSFASASRRASTTLFTRTYASSPYPFTKAEDKQPTASTPSNPYPFTDSTLTKEPTPVSPPTRPMGAVDTGLEQRAAYPDNPDYNVAADYRTSVYTPVPIRVQDGSEPGDVTPAAVLSGAPTELQARTVRIYKPSKPATQSGDWHGHHWQMDWDILPKGNRWENALMGWQSSGDFMQATHMSFKTKEDAIRFAEKQGYEYFVQEPNQRRFVSKAYATQFLHQAKPLKTIRTK